MIKHLFAISLAFSLGIMIFASTDALAGKTYYYVYKYKSTSKCDISTKGPGKSGKGSSWKVVAKSTSRSGAKKKGKSAGCSSF
jgi:uncharacterized membrane-anchored protein